MSKIVLAAAAIVIGICSTPALATDYRYYDGYGRYYGSYEPYFRHDHEIRRDYAEIRRDEERLRRDLWAWRHGAVSRWQIERDRRELHRDFARRRGW